MQYYAGNAIEVRMMRHDQDISFALPTLTSGFDLHRMLIWISDTKVTQLGPVMFGIPRTHVTNMDLRHSSYPAWTGPVKNAELFNDSMYQLALHVDILRYTERGQGDILQRRYI